MNSHKIHAMPNGQGTARLHMSLGYQSVVRLQTINHERAEPTRVDTCKGFTGWRTLVRRRINQRGNFAALAYDAVY